MDWVLGVELLLVRAQTVSSGTADVLQHSRRCRLLNPGKPPIPTAQIKSPCAAPDSTTVSLVKTSSNRNWAAWPDDSVRVDAATAYDQCAAECIARSATPGENGCVAFSVNRANARINSATSSSGTGHGPRSSRRLPPPSPARNTTEQLMAGKRTQKAAAGPQSAAGGGATVQCTTCDAFCDIYASTVPDVHCNGKTKGSFFCDMPASGSWRMKHVYSTPPSYVYNPPSR